jgi:hypothetical protein
MSLLVLHERYDEDIGRFEVWTIWKGLRYSQVIWRDPLWGWKPTWDQVRENVRVAAMKGVR